jgi:CDP-diacylglycerol--serine O-phosphatidyltransferase
MNIKKNIPNAITCLNLLCGCLGIVFALNKEEDGGLIYASYFIGLAAVFDFLDGFVARLLKVNSEIGKQMDTLADMVTFGVLPGIIINQLVYILIMKSAFVGLLGNDSAKANVDYNFTLLIISYFTAFLIPIFSAIRLAKFNIDTRQSDSFIGFPTPANAILIASFPLILQKGVFFQTLILNPYFLIAFTIVMSCLLVSELPLFALKFKNFGWADNKIRFIFLGLSIVLLAIFHVVAVPFIIVLYIILSVINNISKKTV